MTKSRTLRKAGAVVLSLAMAFSVAGVAPSADAAAKTPALSAKKGTIKVGKKKTVKVKNTTAKKVKKLVVSSNKKAVATVKKNSKVKFTVTGKKAGTAKITAKVTLKKKVAGKKVYTLKYTATVKKAATTPTEAPVVAVTGVTLSNSTPKVGDTISATVEPADATNVSFQWFSGPSAAEATTLIEGEASASYTVKDSDLNKFIAVKVAGDNDSTATATTTAAVAVKSVDGELAITAEQTDASEITVTGNGALNTTDYSYAVKRGSVDQQVTVSITADGKAALTLGTPIAAVDYVVTVTPKDTTKKAATATVTGAVAELQDIEFASENLVLTSADGTTGAVGIKAVNQFGKEVPLTSSNLTAYSSISTNVKYDPDKKSVKITTTTALPLTIGSKVTVSLVYQGGTKGYIQKSAELTVAAMAYVKELTFGDLTTSNTALQGKRVTLKNFADDSYYLPIKAKDQYGTDLKAKDLQDMLDGATQTLFVTPTTTMDTYFAKFYKFDTLKDGTVIARFKHAASTPGVCNVSLTSVGGGTFNTTFEISDNPFIAELDVNVPELYAGTRAELVLTAKDQYGDAVNLYDVTEAQSAGKALASYTFKDVNNQTNANSKFEFGAGVVEVVKDSTKKTASFFYTPAGTAKTTTTLTVTTAKPTVKASTIQINARSTVAGIAELASTVNTSLATGQTFDFSVGPKLANNLKFLDSSGAVIDWTNPNGKQVVYKGNATVTDTVAAGWGSGNYFTLAPADTTNFAAAGTNSGSDTTATAGVSLKYTARNIAKTATTDFVATLYMVDASSTPTKVEKKTATFTLTNVPTNDVKYAVSVANNKTLHVGANAAKYTSPSVTIQLTGEANGKAVAVDQSKITKVVVGDNILSQTSATIAGTSLKSIGAKGSATVYVTVSGLDSELTTTLNYDVADSVATTPKFQDRYGNDTTATLENGNTLNVNTTAPAAGGAAGNYYAYVADQYGDVMNNSVLESVKTGKTITAITQANQADIGKKVRVANGSKSIVIDVEEWATAAGQSVTVSGLTAASAPSLTKVTAGATELEATYGAVAVTNGAYKFKLSDGSAITADSVDTKILNSAGRVIHKVLGDTVSAADDAYPGTTVEAANGTLAVTTTAKLPAGKYTIVLSSDVYNGEVSYDVEVAKKALAAGDLGTAAATAVAAGYDIVSGTSEIVVLTAKGADTLQVSAVKKTDVVSDLAITNGKIVVTPAGCTAAMNDNDAIGWIKVTGTNNFTGYVWIPVLVDGETSNVPNGFDFGTPVTVDPQP